jgi:hypothetical protein
VGSSPEELGDFVKRETTRWAQVIRTGNIKAD